MFDPKCYELAEHFLPNGASEARKSELAQDIQDHIELMLCIPEASVTNCYYSPTGRAFAYADGRCSCEPAT